MSGKGRKPGEVFGPQGLIINQNEQVVVTDYGDGDEPGNVQTLTDTNQCLSMITFHALPKTFKPIDIAIYDNNTYFILCGANNFIVVCDSKSRIKHIIGKDKLINPSSVCVKNKTAYVADWDGGCVYKIERFEITAQSEQLNGPYYVTVNSKHQIIVSCDRDIKVLNRDLNILFSLGFNHERDSPLPITKDFMFLNTPN